MSLLTITLLCIAAFVAGFVDAIVGGGGLIQTPAGLICLPNLPVASVIGTLKIPAFCGTASAAVQYLRRIRMNWRLLLPMMICATCCAFCGSFLLTKVHNTFMKPLLLVVLIIVAIYTYTKKSFGQHTEKTHSPTQQLLLAIAISIVIGFYDGFIGPGAGSFLVLGFIAFLGFDFLHASAYAKMVNLATNFGSISLFFLKGKIIWPIAIPMAVCNAIGGIAGAKLALAKGNKFIRSFFLIVVICTLLRFAYDVLFK